MRPDLVMDARLTSVVGTGDVAEQPSVAYEEARARDYIYPILAPVSSLDALVHRIKGPINVIADRRHRRRPELDELGVARMTWGSNLATAAYAEAVRIAALALA